jgi:hypothetical protein
MEDYKRAQEEADAKLNALHQQALDTMKAFLPRRRLSIIP